MAASSSDESSTAPRDFHLSSSLDSGSRLSPNKLKCPLCHKFRKLFYCKECVHSGGFYRSKSLLSEGFADKQKELFEIIHNKHKLEEDCVNLLEKRIEADILCTKIRNFREKNRILKLSLEEKQKRKIEHKRALSELIIHNEKRAKFQAKCDNKVQEVEQYVEDEREKLLLNMKNLKEKKKEVKRLVKIRLQQLSKYIFPISKVYPTKPETEVSGGDSEMVMALAEASQSSDLRGSWEYTENCGEMSYAIVAPSLPASGNYTCYNMWLAQNKEGNNLPATTGSCNNSALDHRNHAYSISAALTYTTQLVHILSFYLNVGLPFKVFYSDFCNRELTEQQFNTRVARLNANILYLCYTQNVDLTTLRSYETVHNLLQLLNFDNEYLGNDEPVELDIETVDALEEPIRCDLQKGDDSDSEEGNSFLVEWEALPNMQYPEIQAGPGNIQVQAVSQVINAQQQASSMAGGLLNSATASIASIWKGFTGR